MDISGKLRIWLRWLAWKAGRPVAALVLLPLVILPWLISVEDFNPVREPMFDFFQRTHPRWLEQDKHNVVLVRIDERSIAEVGQWPWPRTTLGELLQRIESNGAKAIGLDMVLAEPDRQSPATFAATRPELSDELRELLKALPSNDARFAEAIGRLPVVAGRSDQSPDDEVRSAADSDLQQTGFVALNGPDPVAHLRGLRGMLTNLREIERRAAGLGLLTGHPDADGVVRRIPLVMTNRNGGLEPHMVLELIRVATPRVHQSVLHSDERGAVAVSVGENRFPVDHDGTFRVYFAENRSQSNYPAIDVLHGTIDKGIFKDKIVIVGASSVLLHDQKVTPVTNLMDGMEIQANAIETQLANLALVRPESARWIESGALLAAALLLIAFGPRLHPGAVAVGFVVAVSAYFVLSYLAFRQYQLLIDATYPAFSLSMVFISLGVASLVQEERKRRQLDAQLQGQRLENARMSGELGAARKIQMGILPDPRKVAWLPSNVDLDAYLDPAREVGGDLYDAFMLDDHHLFVIMGDVSGKGVASSLFMALSKALCKSAARRQPDDVGATLSIANEEIAQENPMGMFVTAFAAVLDTRSGELEFSNAGHTTPFVVAAEGSVRPVEHAGGPPLCVLDDFHYPTGRTRMEKGDLLVVTTDGVTEATRSGDHMYGEDRMVALLEDLPGEANASEAVAALHRDVKRFVAGAPPSDDITILALRYLGPAGSHQ